MTTHAILLFEENQGPDNRKPAGQSDRPPPPWWAYVIAAMMLVTVAG